MYVKDTFKRLKVTIHLGIKHGCCRHITVLCVILSGMPDHPITKECCLCRVFALKGKRIYVRLCRTNFRTYCLRSRCFNV